MAIGMGIVIGATVLLAEFIKKLQLVRSQSSFVPMYHAVRCCCLTWLSVLSDQEVCAVRE